MARTVALVFGVIYTVVGIIGFIPALGGTPGIAPTPLLKLFEINSIHNIVHLVIGIFGLAVAGSDARAATYLRTFGIILVIIGIVGIFARNPFNIIPIGGADVSLHLITGVIFLIAASTAPKPAAAS